MANKDTTQNNSDERLKGADPREPRIETRDERMDVDREFSESRSLTDNERRRKAREIYQEALLPDLPIKSGFHRCWVSTNHGIDTPQRRSRMGYTFISAEELKAQGWDPAVYAVKDASIPGAVMWREMVGMQIPDDIYQMLMEDTHFTQPQENEASIRDQVLAAQAEVVDRGGRIDVGQGFKDLGKATRVPTFT